MKKDDCMHKKVALFVFMLTGLLQASKDEGVRIHISDDFSDISDSDNDVFISSDASALANPTTKKDFKAMKQASKEDCCSKTLKHKSWLKLSPLRSKIWAKRSKIDIEKVKQTDLTSDQSKEELLEQINVLLSDISQRAKKIMTHEQEKKRLSVAIDNTALRLAFVKEKNQRYIDEVIASQATKSIAKNKKTHKKMLQLFTIIQKTSREIFNLEQQAARERLALCTKMYLIDAKLNRKQTSISGHLAQHTKNVTELYLSSCVSNKKKTQEASDEKKRLVELNEQLQAELSALKDARRKKDREIVCEEVELKRKKIE